MSFHFDWLVIASFAIGGGFGKLADAVIDGELPLQRRWGAVFNLIACGTLGLLARYDPWAAAVVLGIFLGVLLSGKVDSPLHAIGAAVFLGLGVPSLARIGLGESLPIVAAVMAGSCADEYFHERDRSSTPASLLRRVLQYRVVLDLTLLALVLIGSLPFLYCLAMWTFDAAYIVAQTAISARARVRLRRRVLGIAARSRASSIGDHAHESGTHQPVV